MIPALILVVVVATSILSGIVGMAGGMILMALLTLLLSVPVAMLLHGAPQAGANGARAWFLSAPVRWSVLPPYLLGAATCVGVLGVLALVPERGLVTTAQLLAGSAGPLLDVFFLTCLSRRSVQPRPAAGPHPSPGSAAGRGRTTAAIYWHP